MGQLVQGYFTPQNPDKYVGDITKIRYLSSWEHTIMKFFDNNPYILQWNSEDIIIRYYSSADGKYRRYMVDFWIKYKNSKGEIKQELLEVKPKKETQPPKKRGKKKMQTYLKEHYTWQVNVDKWAAAQKYAKERGMEFRIITEDHIFK